MELQQIGTRDALDADGGTLRWTSVGMILGVEELEHSLHRPRARVVLVLAEDRERLGPALIDLRRWKGGISRNVDDDRQDVLEILRETRARDGQRLPVRRNAQRHTAVVEL